MAVFVAVLWAATRESSVGAARRSESNVNRDRGPLRLVPVVSMASVVALCCVALNAELVPRANLRLQALYSGGAVVSPTDRSMTLEELLRAESWQAARADGVASTRTSGSSDANYGLEIHKKFALAAACVVLALFAAGIARRAPHVGVLTQAAISLTVFTSYYVCLIAGEQLADRATVPPAVAMWSANFIVLGFAMLTLRAARVRRALPAMVSRLRG